VKAESKRLAGNEIHCPVNMEWFRIVSLRFHSNHSTVPLCLTTYYILPKYASVVKHKKHLTTPVSEQIVEKVFDEVIQRAKSRYVFSKNTRRIYSPIDGQSTTPRR
jgi:hypothetical protein